MRQIVVHANRDALWAQGEMRSYGELASKASKLANTLKRQGISQGDRVAILYGRNVGLYEAILACLLAGAVYTPLNPRFPVERNASILRASGAKALICDKRSTQHLAQLRAIAVADLSILAPEGVSDELDGSFDVVGAEAIATASADVAAPETRPDDYLYLLFTSGSTGTPKGVPISHANVCAYLDGIAQLSPVSAHDRLVQLVDVTFDLSAHDIFLAWTNGASLYAVPEQAAALAPRFVSDYELTCWLSVPSTAALAAKTGLLEAGAMPSLRLSFFCGEALPDAVAQAWVAAAPNSAVYNLYGPTEATIAFSYFKFDANSNDRPATVPIGFPLSNHVMSVRDENGCNVVESEIGELHLAGRQLTDGYWCAPDITAERFVTLEGIRWYRTGDLVRPHAVDGYRYVGRADHQVKIQGFRVELSEIEAALRAAIDTPLVAVVAMPADEQGIVQGCIAYIAHQPLDTEQLASRLSQTLPQYMIPRQFRFLDALPLNANGKIDYPLLRKPEWMYP